MQWHIQNDALTTPSPQQDARKQSVVRLKAQEVISNGNFIEITLNYCKLNELKHNNNHGSLGK